MHDNYKPLNLIRSLRTSKLQLFTDYKTHDNFQISKRKITLHLKIQLIHRYYIALLTVEPEIGVLWLKDLLSTYY